MLKKLYAVCAYERNEKGEGTIDEILDGLNAQVFTDKESAVRKVIENMKNDLLDLGVGENVVERIMEQHKKGNYIKPSRFWAIVFPFNGGDRGAIEMTDKGFYYRIREVIWEMPNTPIA